MIFLSSRCQDSGSEGNVLKNLWFLKSTTINHYRVRFGTPGSRPHPAVSSGHKNRMGKCSGALVPASPPPPRPAPRHFCLKWAKGGSPTVIPMDGKRVGKEERRPTLILKLFLSKGLFCLCPCEQLLPGSSGVELGRGPELGGGWVEAK